MAARRARGEFDERGGAGKKKEQTPAQRATATYFWFLFAVGVVLAVFGSVFPNMIRLLHGAGLNGGETTDLMTRVGADIRANLAIALAPAYLATLIWLSPLSRPAVHRVLYVGSLMLGTLLIAASVLLYLDFYG